MLDGVRNSADMDEKIGTRFGGLGELTAAASTCRTVSRDGCIPVTPSSSAIVVLLRGLGQITTNKSVAQESPNELLL
jgi:hypothetical protein